MRQISEALGDKTGDTDWTEICRCALLAAQKCGAEKKELGVLVSVLTVILC